MAELNASGKSLVEIQAAWHNYYVSLPEHEKYQVWQEFYVTNSANPAYQQFLASTPRSSPQTLQQSQPVHPTPLVQIDQRPAPAQRPPVAIPRPARTLTPRPRKTRPSAVDQAAAKLKQAVSAENVAGVRTHLLKTVKSAASQNKKGGAAPHAKNVKLRPKHHLQSLAFGLTCGLVLVFVYLFSFFNQDFIAPLIQPSRKVNDTPVIVNTASTTISGGPKVIIPKINVEIPVDYSQTSTDEATIETALESGVVHYPSTVLPGQTGNAAFFGHSSNNIFNPGKYKFAFVLLHELVVGDTFYLTHNGTTYVYKVFSTSVVEPSDVGVLNGVVGHNNTATLITCDPPGTSLHRLIVVGDQISPDPAGNTAPTNVPVQTAVNTTLPGNGPSLWSRIWSNLF
jgi:LPXTG-site transpeptidase (sortase) family protein